MTSYPIGEVARLAGVTVRTLHHYDAIGLLAPTRRERNGRRAYGTADLARLQRILFYRELELPLDEIAGLLDGDDDPRTHLRRQRRHLRGRIDRLELLITTLDRTLEAHDMGIELTPDEMLEVFGDFDPTTHRAEVEQRWGDTDAYRESSARTARYTKSDWQRFADEQEQLNADFVAALRGGEPADGQVAMDLAERARTQIDTWFYPLAHAMHVGLARMYLADPRFTATYERQAPGMARYVHDAIVANAARHGVDVADEGQ